MTITENLRWARVLVLALASAAVAIPSTQDPSVTAPDNTKVNKTDRANGEPTADQAKNNAGDRETMRKIRRAIVSDKSLSTYAHNIKIIAQDGKVTLKGPVRSEEEKQAIESKAAAVAGAENVTDQLTVKPGKATKSESSS